MVSECGENGKTGSSSKTSKSLHETGCDISTVSSADSNVETPPQCVEKSVSECDKNGKTGSPSKTSKSLHETGCDISTVSSADSNVETPPQCVEKSVSECDKNGKTGSPSKTSKSLHETGCDISTVSSADSNVETPPQCVEKSVSECDKNGKNRSPSKTSTGLKVLVENSGGEEEEVFNISLDVGSDEVKEILGSGDEIILNEDISADSSISLLCKEDISYMPLDNTIPKKKRKYSDEENDTLTFQHPKPKPSKILKGVGR